MATASLILLLVSLVVLTAAKPFNNDRIEENPQPRGIQYRLPSLYELYDRYPELYQRQEYPRVLYQPSASNPAELYNGDILQRQPSEDREVAVIPKERLEQQDAGLVEKNVQPEKPSLDEKEQEKTVSNGEQPEEPSEEPQQRPDDEKDDEKETPSREQPEDPAEEPQQRPDDEQEQPKDDKHDDRPAGEHKPHPKPNPKPQKPGKEGDRPRGKPQKRPQDSKRRPAGPRRPLIKPEQKDLEVDAQPLATNPKPDTPLVQINVQVASL
ncbi:uncharacterized protein LOC126576844 [Anopheles aquasalis]|uniref:uncharacterized protein LOC126576844 n=1 Tax=Anopheles aquasalis TaxID=42839 RepID=UPI00215B20EA|nr:uncharacterized protein LOC126576844 [Anopheles aquasalis]